VISPHAAANSFAFPIDDLDCRVLSPIPIPILRDRMSANDGGWARPGERSLHDARGRRFDPYTAHHFC
jgi:hypothetical protein